MVAANVIFVKVLHDIETDTERSFDELAAVVVFSKIS